MDYEQEYKQAIKLLNNFKPDSQKEEKELEELIHLVDQLHQSSVNLDKMLGDVITSQQEENCEDFF